MGNSTQQTEANGGTPLAEPIGSQDCYNCDRVAGRIPGMVYCDLHEEWVNDNDVACAEEEAAKLSQEVIDGTAGETEEKKSFKFD